jgi:ABC-type Fe3+/spermidine/putrescine transport system ATPase subunit
MIPILEVRNLVKDFPGQRAVGGITLSIQPGSFFSLLGPSGCGKTTTLRMIAGFEECTSGEVLLKGALVNHCRPYERNVSTVFQNYALFPHLSARGNIEFGLKRQRMNDIEKRVQEVMNLVGLTGKESRRPAQLSGGERQRVALARSLVLQPDVLLLDEPRSIQNFANRCASNSKPCSAAPGLLSYWSHTIRKRLFPCLTSLP